MVSPRPVPGVERAAAMEPRSKGSKMRWRSSARMPRPVSRIVKTAIWLR